MRRLRPVLRGDPLNPVYHNITLLMEIILIGFIAFACLVYLVVAVLRPEKS